VLVRIAGRLTVWRDAIDDALGEELLDYMARVEVAAWEWPGE
jgi:hypothetical protein